MNSNNLIFVDLHIYTTTRQEATTLGSLLLIGGVLAAGQISIVSGVLGGLIAIAPQKC